MYVCLVFLAFLSPPFAFSVFVARAVRSAAAAAACLLTVLAIAAVSGLGRPGLLQFGNLAAEEPGRRIVLKHRRRAPWGMMTDTTEQFLRM